MSQSGYARQPGELWSAGRRAGEHRAVRVDPGSSRVVAGTTRDGRRWAATLGADTQTDGTTDGRIVKSLTGLGTSYYQH